MFDIWHMLRGEELNGIKKRNVKIILMIILGFYSNWMNST